MARTLATLAILTTIAKAQMPQLEGCYSSAAVASFRSAGEYPYQSVGYCSDQCSKQDASAIALTNGNECWCGSMLPTAPAVDKAACDLPCDGYPFDMCGGDDVFSVYSMSASGANAPVAGNSSSSVVASSPTNATTSTASPSLATGLSANRTTGMGSATSSMAGGAASTSVEASTGGVAGRQETVAGAAVALALVAFGIQI